MSNKNVQRGIFGNITYMVSKIADAVGTSADAVATGAGAVDKVMQMGDNLANTGVTLTESNHRLVSIECQGEEAVKLNDLYSRFPHLAPEGYTTDIISDGGVADADKPAI